MKLETSKIWSFALFSAAVLTFPAFSFFALFTSDFLESWIFFIIFTHHHYHHQIMSKAKGKRSSASAAPPPKLLLQAANSRQNPLSSLGDFDVENDCLWRKATSITKTPSLEGLTLSDEAHKQEGSELELRIICRTWAQLDEQTRSWMLDLTEANMAEYYRASAWGWNRSAKEGELKATSARHLLVYKAEGKDLDQENTGVSSSNSNSSKSNSSQTALAFVHFRFEEGYAEDATLYCYELQLVEGVRRRGIGATLMNVLQELATVHRMRKVLLTVLTGNTEAVQFYVKGLNFAVDRHSPSRFKDSSSVDYEILSKKVAQDEFGTKEKPKNVIKNNNNKKK